ncbi:MAG: Ig-like domain-containing protein [Syntrophomonas sp.]
MKISCLRKKGIFRTMVLMLVMIAFAIPVSAATYTYDNLGRLTSATNSSGASCTYTDDAGGNLLSSSNQSSLTVFITTPQDQTSNVPIGQSVYMQFSINIEQYKNFNNISLMSGQTPFAINTSINNDMLNIDPVDNLAINTEYTVTVPADAMGQGDRFLVPSKG